ncbi:DUF2867 domain-containing protein [Saccharopolyspora pogona]|uniref:DUF2867 domain-containing protein n=1 Tax=Saccharopolyspora pogona TaxID=333966 RepID=UPI00168325F2|nr:DUF2867 domain-containing protein [Saccharopolyspora pogona]
MTPHSTVQAVEDLLEDADHVDTETVRTTTPLRVFIAAAPSRRSPWMRLLWRARKALAVALRLRDTKVPNGDRISPEEVSFTPGDKLAFFTVKGGEEDRYLILEASDNHLVGYLALVAEPAEERMSATTVVHYKNWRGRLYFTVIRPFHHMIVKRMLQAATTTKQDTKE